MSTKTRVTLVVALISVSLSLSMSLAGCAAAGDEVAEPASSESQTQTQTPTPNPVPALTEGELLAWKQLAAANPNTLGPGEGEIEYAQARRDFPLEMPEGTAIPETTTFNFYAPDGLYERGMGYGLVSWTWLCATESELLDAIKASDDERVNNSFAQLDLWITLPAKQRMFEGIDAFRASVLDPARAGDTQLLEADRQSWCGQAPFTTT